MVSCAADAPETTPFKNGGPLRLRNVVSEGAIAEDDDRLASTSFSAKRLGALPPTGCGPHRLDAYCLRPMNPEQSYSSS